LERAIPVDATIAASAHDHHLDKASLAKQTLRQSFEAGGWELDQQVDKLALDVCYYLCLSLHLLDGRF
jgi:hypothetical protein